MRHSLTNKDKALLTGDCSVCGPAVSIVKVGNGHGCRVAVRQAKRNYKKAHPERARAASSYNPSAHRLVDKTCAICGPVEPEAWGRGWMCPTILKEKGWTNEQKVPVPRCALCNKRFLDAAGKCPSCDAQYEDLVRGIDPAFLAEVYAAGMHIESGPAYLETDTTSVVPGWKTLGSGLPEKQTVRPEYAALYGSGSR